MTFARCAIVTNDGRRVRPLWRSFRERQQPRHGPPCVQVRDLTGRNTKTNKMIQTLFAAFWGTLAVAMLATLAVQFAHLVWCEIRDLL